MVAKVNYGSLPFKEQIAYFRNKTNTPTERWTDLWQNAHDRGFMVAGAMKEDLLADFRTAVDKAISEGKSLNWFQSQFDTIVAKHGWVHNGTANWRAELIYQTNIRQSYAAGREQQMQALKHIRPYGLYKHSGAEVPRLEHKAWDGWVVHLDDPWWDIHTPTNGFGCGCKKYSLSERDVKRQGLTVTSPPEIEYYDWTDKVTGEAHKVPKGISPGFDYAPRSSAQLTQRTKAALDKKVPLASRLPERMVDSAYSTVDGVSAKSLSETLAKFDTPEMGQFANALNKHDIKTLFLEESYLLSEDKAGDIVLDVMSYLNWGLHAEKHPFMRSDAKDVGGYSHPDWDHVILKVNNKNKFSKVDSSVFGQGVSDVIDSITQGTVEFTFSDAIARLYGNNEALIAAWIHEVGHILYIKKGSPALPANFSSQALTVYARSEQEWLSEHLVAWVLAPDALKRHRPEIYQFIEGLLK